MKWIGSLAFWSLVVFLVYFTSAFLVGACAKGHLEKRVYQTERILADSMQK